MMPDEYPKCTCGNGEPCVIHTPMKAMGMSDTRVFQTGATRGTDDEKLDYEGFISPLVWKRYAEYMHECRLRNVPPGQTIRSSDNWQKGIPLNAYMKSGFRHFMDWWLGHRRMTDPTLGPAYNTEEALCALLFNVQGYLHECLKKHHQ